MPSISVYFHIMYVLRKNKDRKKKKSFIYKIFMNLFLPFFC